MTNYRDMRFDCIRRVSQLQFCVKMLVLIIQSTPMRLLNLFAKYSIVYISRKHLAQHDTRQSVLVAYVYQYIDSFGKSTRPIIIIDETHVANYLSNGECI